MCQTSDGATWIIRSLVCENAGRSVSLHGAFTSISHQPLPTSKFHNFHIRAPFLTFFILTRRWRCTLQLFIRLHRLIFNFLIVIL